MSKFEIGRGIQCCSWKFVERFGKEGGTQIGMEEGAKLSQGIPYPNIKPAKKSNLLSVPPMSLGHDYRSLKIAATIFEKLEELHPTEIPESFVAHLQVLGRMNRVFLNHSCKENLLRENLDAFNARPNDVDELVAIGQKLEQSRLDEERNAGEKICEAAIKKRLLTLKELDEIFFILGRKLNISIHSVVQLIGRLRQSEEFQEGNHKSFDKVTRKFRKQTEGPWNILTVGNRFGAILKISSDGRAVLKQKPKINFYN